MNMSVIIKETVGDIIKESTASIRTDERQSMVRIRHYVEALRRGLEEDTEELKG